MSKRRIVGFVLIGIAVVIGGLFAISLYRAQQIWYNYEHFNELYDKSLDDLKNGRITVLQYCDTPVHDEQTCTDYKNLHGLK